MDLSNRPNFILDLHVYYESLFVSYIDNICTVSVDTEVALAANTDVRSLDVHNQHLVV